ncbi:hypothetical protein TNCV_1116581 [Trichonephila clavipes]|nr:hypothetical protein TNCV_1116581 [Trichonephila clavipes]
MPSSPRCHEHDNVVHIRSPNNVPGDMTFLPWPARSRDLRHSTPDAGKVVPRCGVFIQCRCKDYGRISPQES